MADEKQLLQDELVKLTTTLRTEFEAKLKGLKTEADFKAFEEKILKDQKAIIDKLAELQKPPIQVPDMGQFKIKNPEHTKNWFAYVRGKEFDRKALISDATGSLILPAEIEAGIKEGLPQINVMRNICGVRAVDRSRVEIRYMTSPTVGWGKLELGGTPSTATLVPSVGTHYIEDLTGLVQIGVDELADTDINLADYIVRQFLVAFQNAENAAFVVGRGHTTYQEPVGLFSSGAGITTVALDAAGATTFDDIKDLIGGLPSQYLPGASFLMHRGTKLVLQKLRAVGAEGPLYADYLWQPSLIAGQPDTLCGYPVYTNDSIPQVGDGTLQKVVAFGDFRRGYEIIDRQGATLTRLNELYITSGLIGFLAVRRVTGGVVLPDAIRILVEP